MLIDVVKGGTCAAMVDGGLRSGVNGGGWLRNLRRARQAAFVLSDSREWIEQRHTGRGNVCNIASDECQAVNFGSRRQQAVDQG